MVLSLELVEKVLVLLCVGSENVKSNGFAMLSLEHVEKSLVLL